MIVVSPHLDDAVWSALWALQRAKKLGTRSMVVTVFAGLPKPDTPPNQFDERAGFDTGRAAMTARRKEDDQAAEAIGFDALHLDYLDVTYQSERDLRDCMCAVEDARIPGELVLGPLGIGHPDHLSVAHSFREATKRYWWDAWVYEELPYAYKDPPQVARALEDHTIDLSRVGLPKQKGNAVLQYQSQSRDCSWSQILAPERYHRIRGERDL